MIEEKKYISAIQLSYLNKKCKLCETSWIGSEDTENSEIASVDLKMGERWKGVKGTLTKINDFIIDIKDPK